MKQIKCDVAVIGSGVGGTTAAAMLSKAGYKTIVVEKLPFVGGRCATLDYHGYKINTGAALVSEKVYSELFKEVGVSVEIRVPNPVYVFRIKGKNYAAPPKGIWKAILSQATKDKAEAERVWQAMKRTLSWSEPSYSMSLEDWARQYTDNPIILGIFQVFAAGNGLNSSEFPAGEYFKMFREIPVSDLGTPPLGCGQLSDALVEVIKKMGGEVWTSCPAIQIKVKDEVTTGVVVKKDGEEIEITAQAVISNAPPHRTVELAGRKYISSGYMKDVEAVKSTPMICFYMSSDRPILEDYCWVSLTESHRIFSIFNYTNLCPEMSPKGKYLIEAASVLTSSLPPYDIKREVELSLQDLKDNIPDFDKYAQIFKIKCAYGDWGVLGTWPGYSLPVYTPVYGLYLAGDRSAPLGWWGSIAAVKSGRLVVEDVKRRFKPV